MNGEVVYTVDFKSNTILEHELGVSYVSKGILKHFGKDGEFLSNAKETIEEAEDFMIKFYENRVDYAMEDLNEVVKSVNDRRSEEVALEILVGYAKDDMNSGNVISSKDYKDSLSSRVNTLRE